MVIRNQGHCARNQRGWTLLRTAVVLFLLMLAVLVAGGVWLGTPSGLKFIVDQVRQSSEAGGGRFRVQGLTGGLYSGLKFSQIEWSDGATELSARDVETRWSLSGIAQLSISIPQVIIRELEVTLPEPSDEPEQPKVSTDVPGYFGLPVAVDLGQFKLNRLVVKQVGADKDQALVRLSNISLTMRYAEGAFDVRQLHVGSKWGQISEARISINDKAPHALVMRAQIDADLAGQQAKVTAAALGNLNGLSASLTGSVANSPIALQARLKPLNPLPVVSIDGWIRRFDLSQFDKSFPRSSIDAEIQMLNASALPQVEEPLSVRAKIHRDGEASAPDGSPLVPVESEVVKSTPGTPLTQSVAVWSGSFSANNTASGPGREKLLPVHKVSTALRLDYSAQSQGGILRLSGLNIELPGANADASIKGYVDLSLGGRQNIAGTELPVIVAALDVRNIDLAQFTQEAPATALGGTLDISGGMFALDLKQSKPLETAGISIPGKGLALMRARGVISDQAIRLKSSRLVVDGTTLRASGDLELSEPMKVKASGQVRAFRPSRWISSLNEADNRWQNTVVSGYWSLNGEFGDDLDMTVSARLRNSRALGKKLQARVEGRVRRIGEKADWRLSSLRSRFAIGDNSFSARGAIGEAQDKLTINMRINTPQLFDPRLRGGLSLNANVIGNLANPSANLTLSGRNLEWASGSERMRLKSIELQANSPDVGAPGAATQMAAKLRLRSLSAGGQKISRVQLDFDGSSAEHHFDLSGRAAGQNFQITGDGQVLSTQKPKWRAQLRQLEGSGKLKVSLNSNASKARLLVGSDFAELADLALLLNHGQLTVERGRYQWSPEAQFRLLGRASELPLSDLLELAGQSLDDKSLEGLRLQGNIDINGSSVDDLSGQLELKLSEQRGKKSIGLAGQNEVSLKFDKGNLDGQVDLSLPSLVFSRRFTGPDWQIDGRLAFAGNVDGTISKPSWAGRLTARELSLFQPATGWRLDKGSLDAVLRGRDIKLKHLRLHTGDGSIQMSGKARLIEQTKASKTLPLTAQFKLDTQRFIVPLGPGQKIVLSGKTRLLSDGKKLTWVGKMLADEGLIEIAGSGAPTLPDDVLIIDETESDKKTSAPTSAKNKKAATPSDDTSQQIASDLAIDLGEHLRIVGGGVDAELTGQLKLMGNLPKDARLVGTVNIVNGSYAAYGQDLVITRGAVRFNGAVDNPVLDIVANRPKLPVQVGVALTGTALSPRVQLVSKPDMSDVKKLSWLVLGAPVEDAPGAAQSLALKQAATSLLGQNDGSIAGSSLADTVGLDSLGFGYASDTGQQQAVADDRSPTGLPGANAEGSSGARQAVVSASRRLSDRLTISYEKGVSGIWNLLRIQYDISKRLSLRAQTGSENAVDLIYFYSFD